MAHKWRFFRAGGVDQVQVTTGADLAHLGELDHKLWVALACPVADLALEAKTLTLIDTDGDRRIRAQELIAAGSWLTGCLKDRESVAKTPDTLDLHNITDATEEGRELSNAVRALLSASGRSGEESLRVSDVAEASLAFAKQPFNGDGIVPPQSASTDAARAALADVIAHSDAPLDRSGEKGASADTLKSFFADLDAYLEWLELGASPDIRALGDATEAAHGALSAVKGKVDDFFGRARIAAYDARSLEALNIASTEYVPVAAKDIAASAQEIAHFPLAKVEAGASLPLDRALNPAWAPRMDALKTQVIEPLLGPQERLTAEGWSVVQQRFEPYQAWLAKKPTGRASALSRERALSLKAPTLRDELFELVARDEAERPRASLLDKVEKLVYLHRDLLKVAQNFVSFRTFYSGRERAAFQDGTLFVDQRECELVLRVDDPAKHAVLASLSKCFLIYCEIRNAKGEKRNIVAALTNGSSDNVTVGRNGVFYDRKGQDWDVTITKVVDGPISVRAAFWTPYKKVLRSVEEFVTKRAAAAEASSDQKLTSAVESAQSAASGAPKEVKPAKIDVGVVAALGVAVGGITAALGALLQSFFGLGIWMPLGVLGIVLVISGPSMAIAWLKLRQRNLAPLLDANGWAINKDAKLNVRFGEALTRVATLPKGSARDLVDPFAEKRRPVWLYAFFALVMGLGIAWYLGELDAYLPEKARSTEVLGDAAPAKVQIVEETPAKVLIVPEAAPAAQP